MLTWISMGICSVLETELRGHVEELQQNLFPHWWNGCRLVKTGKPHEPSSVAKIPACYTHLPIVGRTGVGWCQYLQTWTSYNLWVMPQGVCPVLFIEAKAVTGS